MNIKLVPLHEIKPYDNNPRHHPVKQLEAISNSIKRFGFRGSLLLDRDNVIVAGHARYEAATTCGLESVPCEYADDLTEDEIAAYRVLDNKIAEMSSDDDEKLQIELAKLPDFDFAEFNVEFPKIEVLNEGLCDEDETPELKIEATTKLGDVWVLGQHRLMCGDSTMIDHVEKLMAGEKADMVYCDPPYGINLETNYKKRYGHEKGSTASQFYGEDTGIDLTSILNHPYSVQAKDLFVWGADNYSDCLPRGGSWVVWDKSVEAVDGIASDFELCWSRERHHYSMYRKLWKGAKAREETGQEGSHRTRWGHPTQKPIELAVYFFDKWGKKSSRILDYFGGSGTTLIACEKTNRRCFMMELSEQYNDVIIKRWMKFTGKEAIHEATGKTWTELNQEMQTVHKTKNITDNIT